MNSAASWSGLAAVARIKRGGYLEAEAQYVEQLPIPDISPDVRSCLAALGEACTKAAQKRLAIQFAVRHRILDLAPPERRKFTGRLNDWRALDFNGFRKEINHAFRAEIPVKERAEWEAYLAANAREVNRLSAEIAEAEAEIDRVVYGLFDLTPEEIALLEASLAGQY